jgi:hypothetical protein
MTINRESIIFERITSTSGRIKFKIDNYDCALAFGLQPKGYVVCSVTCNKSYPYPVCLLCKKEGAEIISAIQIQNDL